MFIKISESKEVEILPRTIIKGVLSWAIGACAGSVTKQIIEHNTSSEGTLQSFQKYVGSAAITMVVKEAVRKSIHQQVDEMADLYKDLWMDKELRNMVEEENGVEG